MMQNWQMNREAAAIELKKWTLREDEPKSLIPL